MLDALEGFSLAAADYQAVSHPNRLTCLLSCFSRLLNALSRMQMQRAPSSANFTWASSIFPYPRQYKTILRPLLIPQK